ncbi:MAG: SusC/RagA family TonB-linked outer membrane protein, partial [Mucinivorans sp.]
VLIGNNNKAALTDASGMATLKNVPANGQVLVSFVGMTTQTVSINGKNKVQVELTPDAINIQDVVVVGFGSTKKVNLTGAVASVNSKVLEDRPITNLGQGLQGVVPNLNITTGTGMPGQGASYNIRGTTSLNGGGPLILIDGVQMDPNLINPQDVSNVTVLKDAASAAIYGARGAYGVILITTKQGHSDQKPTLSVSANLGFHQPTTLPTPLRSVDYANYVNMVANNSGWGSPFFDKEYMDHIYAYQANPTPENSVFIHSQSGNKNQYDYCGETDWYRDIMNEVALNQQYNIQLNGGTKNTSYFLSMGLVRDKGMLKAYPDKNTRWNTNINVKSQVTKWLEISGRAMYNFSVGDIPNTNFVNWQNGLFLNGLRPLMPIYHPDGHYSGQGIWTHPMAVAEQGGFQTNRRSDLWLTGAIKATPIKGMNIVADYTFNYYNQDVQDKTRQFYEYTAVPGTEQLYPWTKPSYVQNYTNQDTYSAFNAYIDYERQMRRHYLKVMVGYNQENKFNRGYGASRPNMISDDMNFIGLATGDISLVNN